MTALNQEDGRGAAAAAIAGHGSACFCIHRVLFTSFIYLLHCQCMHESLELCGK